MVVRLQSVAPVRSRRMRVILAVRERRTVVAPAVQVARVAQAEQAARAA